MLTAFTNNYYLSNRNIKECSMCRTKLKYFDDIKDTDKRKLYSYIHNVHLESVKLTQIRQFNKEIDDWMSRSQSEYFGIFAKDELAGTISLSKQHIEEGYASIGYEIFPEFRSMGIATEAFTLMLDIAGSRGFKFVKGKVRNDNEYSLRIWQKHNAQSIELADGMLEMRVEIKEKKC